MVLDHETWRYFIQHLDKSYEHANEEQAMKLILTEEIWKEGNMYVSYCPELDMASCGQTVDQAQKNLKEVIQINLAEAEKMGTLDDLLSEAGFLKDPFDDRGYTSKSSGRNRNKRAGSNKD